MPNEMSETNMNNHEFQHALIKAILESAPDGILVVDHQGVIISYNHRFIEVWELPVNHPTYGSRSDILIGGEDKLILAMVADSIKDTQAFLARVQELYDHPELNDSCELELKDGRTLERNSTVLWGDNGHNLGRVWFFRDITTHKKVETELLKLTRHDPLTGIANRRYFFEQAIQEFVRAKRYLTPLCIASIDIDHFKTINDTYGHAAGDEMLKSLCRVSQLMLRETDFMARIGGEEFAILIPGTKLEEAILLAERVRKVVAEDKVTFNNQEFNCTISIGIAELSPTDAGIDECMNRADKALYISKENGRNRVASLK